MRLFITFLLIFVGITTKVTAQHKILDKGFRSPVDFPIYLSGTFGELRSNHFHSGIDIKTGGVEGKKVFAVEDGYVSRIKVSIWGYGKALYITHPNGYVSVYGHLKRYNDTIAKYVKEAQYDRKTFEIEIFPEKNELKVKKGEVIAYSGNTGGSAGPHLHFEIRKALNQHPVNPLFFKNIKIKDITKPRIKMLAIYPQSESAVINDINETARFVVNGWGLKHYLKDNPEIKVHGKVSFGLQAYDLMDGLNNKNGIYSQRMYIDSNLVFYIKMDELSFATTRYINSLIDYAYYKKKKARIVETRLDTNNRLNIYSLVKNNGIFDFSDTQTHKITFVVEDAYGNEGRLSFTVKGYEPDTVIVKSETISGDTVFNVHYNKDFEYTGKGYKVSIPADALYRTTMLAFSVDTEKNNFLSPVYDVGQVTVPLQKYMTLSIKPDTLVSASLASKLCVVSVDKKGRGWYVGGKPDNDYLTIKTRNFGSYAVMIDTVCPEIRPVNITGNKKISNLKYLKFKIKDNFSGIKSYAGFLNGKWILMEYEPKKNILFYHIDERMKKGKNILKLYVFDNRGNKTEYKTELYY